MRRSAVIFDRCHQVVHKHASLAFMISCASNCAVRLTKISSRQEQAKNIGSTFDFSAVRIPVCISVGLVVAECVHQV